jgi:hypothetical protein
MDGFVDVIQLPIFVLQRSSLLPVTPFVVNTGVETSFYRLLSFF